MVRPRPRTSQNSARERIGEPSFRDHFDVACRHILACGHLDALDADYPDVIVQPQGNHQGMPVFSRLESADRKCEKDTPSIRGTLSMSSGALIELLGLHPRPHVPHHDTDEREGECLMVGMEAWTGELPATLAGDLNGVALSVKTWRFQRISGLLDPRRGRGTVSTFPGGCPLFRWPLDHVIPEKSVHAGSTAAPSLDRSRVFSGVSRTSA
jgi:endonuclease/exonuclease/phosphatase (EEP) superfamily protein YafD